jgi:PKHD-type hydroxylase
MPYKSDRRWTFQPGHHVVKAVLTPDQCAAAQAAAAGRDPIRSQMQGRVASHRDSDIWWLKPGDPGVQPIFETLRAATDAFNAQTYRFEIDGAMDLQLTRYGPGGHYEWHADLAANFNSRRKLSMSVLLSDPSAFTGGGLQFFEATHHQPSPALARGDAVFFPSWCKHRVLPVDSGERWSLVCWWTGPPFR